MSAGSGSLRPLCRALVRSGELAARPDAHAPDIETLDLPEKVVQFGTGAFLRGFVGFFIDEANRQRRFAGRIVAVGSTASGREQTFTRQDGLYTLAAYGVSRGVARSSRRVITAYSRALSAQRQWPEVLELARRPELELIFSNTTEAGIVLDAKELDPPSVSGEGDERRTLAPRSFPGKLTMFLYERGRAFGYAPDRGVVVLPCELIDDNGDRLREIVLALAQRWRLDPAFGDWIEHAVPFCNTLVDRIVSGTPEMRTLEHMWSELAYRDDLLTVCEDYRLFAIQADAAVRERLGFADADPGIIITDDVTPFRERKVRLLNAAHSLLAPVGILCGCRTVKDALDDAALGAFVRGLLLDELASGVNAKAAGTFARDVLDRFANPFLDHALVDITLQQTAKLRIRAIPSLTAHARKSGRPPPSVAFGLAAWLYFMRPDLQGQRQRDVASYRADDHADHVATLWSRNARAPLPLAALVHAVLADASLWGEDLTGMPGLAEAVAGHLARIARDGARAAVEHHLAAATQIEGRTG